MDAREFLRALNAAIPDAKISLRVEGNALIVGLCDRAAGRFYDAALDEADHARTPEDVAKEVAAFYVSAKAAP